jgi:hypothetical protein
MAATVAAMGTAAGKATTVGEMAAATEARTVGAIKAGKVGQRGSSLDRKPFRSQLYSLRPRVKEYDYSSRPMLRTLSQGSPRWHERPHVQQLEPAADRKQRQRIR